jgi:hypothetical protein
MLALCTYYIIYEHDMTVCTYAYIHLQYARTSSTTAYIVHTYVLHMYAYISTYILRWSKHVDKVVAETNISTVLVLYIEI